MENKEMIMDTVNTAAQEVVKKTDYKGIIFVGLGFVGGTAITVGVVKGVKKLKKVREEKKSKKEIPYVVVTDAQ